MRRNEPSPTRQPPDGAARGPVVSVRELAAVILSMRKLGIADRGLIVRMLRAAIANYPEYLGLWCVFEPNAFDGRDAEFVGRPGHDGAGRFAPRWDRNHGALRFGCSHGHDSPRLGAWYHLARDARQEVVFGPYDERALTGLPVLCLSRLAPLIERGRFVGAVGLDISLDSLRASGMACHRGPIDLPVESMLERWHLFLHDDGRIECASRTARRLVAHHFGPCRRGRLPPVLEEWLRVSAGSSVSIARDRAGLRVTAVRHPHNGRTILSLEASRGARRRIELGGAGLSVRERDVLQWVGEGKSNAEISLILGISEHTVRHHLERIFVKLGVENRRAATLCIHGIASHSARCISRVPAGDEPAE